MKSKYTYAYFGHHKCATGWITGIIFSVCRSLGLKYGNVLYPKMFKENLKKYVGEKGIDFLTYTNADFRYVKELDNLKGFHVIRDPRDIVVSAYFSHLIFEPSEHWPAAMAHKERLKAVSMDEGLFLEMKFREEEFQELYNWDYSQPNIFEIKIEKLIKEPDEIFVQIFKFLQLVENENISVKKQIAYLFFSKMNEIHGKSRGLIPFHHKLEKIPLKKLLLKIRENKFSKKAQGRKPGQEDLKSHYRRGVAGDWVNHFSEAHIKCFKENYNDLLIKLGYESGSDW